MSKLGGKVTIRRREMSCNVGHKCKRNNARIPGPQFNLLFAIDTFMRHEYIAYGATARNVRHAVQHTWWPSGQAGQINGKRRTFCANCGGLGSPIS